MSRLRRSLPTALVLAAAVGCVPAPDAPEQPASGTPEQPAPSTADTELPPPPEVLSASELVDELSELHPMDEARDATSACQSDSGSEHDCITMVKTEEMSVYEFRDVESAEHWVEQMGRTGDARRVDRFMLYWPEGWFQSDREHDELTARAREIVDGHNAP
ncbi:hypothetical protein [Salinactinospora qingdaonensis]|uniref:Lipoprotein n=1 Tax=Salinactinospora qingdaonensis TaxID=702744 RepID=A0ABP7GEX9_9ACTN